MRGGCTRRAGAWSSLTPPSSRRRCRSR
uniref:Uncharacterized protein n=1 Tax=Arundo donax TaxID=35708 RepID=A0A0A9H035_ARUDO